MRNNHRRDIFLSAATSTNNIQSTIGQWLIEGRYNFSKSNLQPLLVFAYEQTGRLQANVYQFANMFFIAAEQQTLDAFQRMIANWNQGESQTAKELIGVINGNPNEVAAAHFSDMQTFLLGYYYGLLRSLLDVSQIVVQEAFGSWAWDDWELFNYIKSAGPSLDLGSLELRDGKDASHHSLAGSRPYNSSPVSTRNSPNHLRFWERHFVLKLAAYLFGGAEMKQIRAAERGCCGIKGKLTVVDATLLGKTDHWSRVRNFVLLDVDDTVFPSDSRGIIRSGGQDFSMNNCTLVNIPDPVPLEDIKLARGTPDFNTLVEPKWDEDMNACMVTFRRQGRLVHSMDPDTIFHAILAASTVSPEVDCHSEAVRFVTDGLSIAGKSILDEKDQEQCKIQQDITGTSLLSNSNDIWSRVGKLTLEQFDGGKIPVMPRSGSQEISRICVATNGLPKMKTCLVSACNVPYTFNTLHFPVKRELTLPRAAANGLVVDLDHGQILVK
jgi:hypothetical protein